MSMYRVVMRGCGAIAALGCVVYIMSVGLSAVDGPGGVEVPDRVDMIIVSVTVLCAMLSVGGWMIQTAGRERSAEITHALAGALEQQLVKNGEHTAARAVAAVRQMLEDQNEVIQSAVSRAHTRGMIAEAGARSNGGGNVASISRRDT